VGDLLECEHVGFEYHRRPIFQDLSFTVEQGSWSSIVGPSGIGKTTLLYLIAGFLKPTRGQILESGSPIVGPGVSRGVVLQDLALFPWLNVLGNVTFGLDMTHMPRDQKIARAMANLALVGLTDHAHDRIDQLSGGMRQRVALARTLAMGPRILLLDEAFSALDANTRSILGVELRRIHEHQDLTTILITHSIDEALAVSDRVIAINGDPAEIRGDLTVPRGEDRALLQSCHDTVLSWIA